MEMQLVSTRFHAFNRPCRHARLIYFRKNTRSIVVYLGSASVVFSPGVVVVAEAVVVVVPTPGVVVVVVGCGAAVVVVVVVPTVDERQANYLHSKATDSIA